MDEGRAHMHVNGKILDDYNAGAYKKVTNSYKRQYDRVCLYSLFGLRS